MPWFYWSFLMAGMFFGGSILFYDWDWGLGYFFFVLSIITALISVAGQIHSWII